VQSTQSSELRDDLSNSKSENSRLALAANLAIVLRRRRCLITSPPQDGLDVVKHGATPKAFGAESAIHEEVSYSPAQFRKADELPLTSVFSPQAGRGVVLYATFGLESWRTASISTSDMSGIEH